MKDIWPKLVEANVNTVLGCVTWEQIEPKENIFDFTELDQIILDARSFGLRLVLLWFGTWKNGLSNYVPSWVKKNDQRFPRACLRNAGGRLETADILSVFGTESQKADSKAFASFMQHLKAVDENHSTVLMVQVENEVGILGDSRDGSYLANETFAQPVPPDLLQLLNDQWTTLHNSLKNNLNLFKSNTSLEGSWAKVFGDTAQTDEIFMAYHYALYLEKVASAGKSVYPLPMYTNCWQKYGDDDRDKSFPAVVGGGNRPGEYPSGGPVSNVLDIWQLFAPSLDFIAPDIYLNDYSVVCSKYRHREQLLFVPEQRRDEYGARRAWKAFGSYHAVGVAPFGADTVELEHGHNPYRKHYHLLSRVSHMILAAQRAPGTSYGFFFDEIEPATSDYSSLEHLTVVLGTWKLTIERSFVFGRPSAGCGNVIQIDTARFLLIGWGFQVTFHSTDDKSHFTGILSFKEKEVTDAALGEMKTLRILNGDETRSGKAAIMPSDNPDYGGFPISITIPAKTGIAEVEVYSLKHANEWKKLRSDT
ncbi:MAG: hypothetical protein Q9227_007495 [Pyrenula ochraceoflavens]